VKIEKALLDERKLRKKHQKNFQSRHEKNACRVEDK
jgi:hypothetical protein